ncbi:MAG: HepT-like ribonuclease domain-containing protein [Thermodesulfobacteriota bacterium]
MSSRSARLRIQDIVDAIGRVCGCVQGMTYAEFCQDHKTISALERELILIGEAAQHVPLDVVERSPEVPWTRMKGMRNVIVHRYWGVDRKRLWTPCTKICPC